MQCHVLVGATILHLTRMSMMILIGILQSTLKQVTLLSCTENARRKVHVYSYFGVNRYNEWSFKTLYRLSQSFR